ncbi:MAG: MATE family efflux transporter, partial [Lachnospiraceae bacterium]|nr:MATE family efflux transporter [Lachnospiraceae bacterium]
MKEKITTTEKKDFYRKAIGLTWPIVIQNLLSAFISSADVIMLNFVGQKAIAAVSLASQANSLLFMFLYGISAGAGMLCAQYYGKGDLKA